MDLGVFGIFCLLSFAAISALFGFLSSPGTASLTAVIVVQALVDLLWIGFAFFLSTVIHGFSFKETFGWQPQHQFRTGFLVSAGIALALTAMVVSSIVPSTSQTSLEKLISSAKSLYVFVFFGIALAPLLEEMIVRGFLFKVFLDIRGPGVAVVATALLFALLHSVDLWGNWFAILWILIVGYVLGIVRNRSGSVIPGIIIHTTYNAVLLGLYAVHNGF